MEGIRRKGGGREKNKRKMNKLIKWIKMKNEGIKDE